MKKTTLKLATVIVALAGVFSVSALQTQLVKPVRNTSLKIKPNQSVELTEVTKGVLIKTDYVRYLTDEHES